MDVILLLSILLRFENYNISKYRRNYSVEMAETIQSQYGETVEDTCFKNIFSKLSLEKSGEIT